jgi:hypothetical protein
MRLRALPAEVERGSVPPDGFAATQTFESSR